VSFNILHVLTQQQALVKRLIFFLVGSLLQFGAQAELPPRIAAASSLQYALPEILQAFQSQTGLSVRVTYGSSGNFSRQIAQGAPFQLFLAADESYIAALVEQGLTLDSGQVYALGRVAAIVPKSSDIKLTQDLSGLRSAIDQGRLQRFAIANPDHAPYGRAARETLESLGLWQSIRPYLVMGENASQATQFAISGSSQGGIVPFTLAISPAVANAARVMLIPASLHRPIRQRMVLLAGAGETARRFFDFVGGAESRSIFTRYGYEIPTP
jgi:molybdate transport system substrate-binding protein